MEFIRNLGPYIDLSCRGITINNNKIYRVFNILFELKDHCRKLHFKKFIKYWILINIKINNDNYKLILNKNGKCEEHYYIDENYLLNNDLIKPYDDFIQNERQKIKSNNKKKNV